MTSPLQKPIDGTIMLNSFHTIQIDSYYHHWTHLNEITNNILHVSSYQDNRAGHSLSLVMCWWLYLASGSCGFCPWNMSSVSEKCCVICPRCWGVPCWTLLAWNLLLWASLHFKAEGENVCSLWWNVFVCTRMRYVCVCKRVSWLMCVFKQQHSLGSVSQGPERVPSAPTETACY